MVSTHPIQARRLSQVVASELRARILRGEFDGVERVPPEPEFAQQLGVSRYHLREALRLLEHDGLVEVRAGRSGGIFLTHPQDDGLARTFAGNLGRKGTSLADLFAARLVIEPSAAELAASAASDADLANLRALLDKEQENQCYDAELNSRFHIAVTASAHNDTLLLMMRSIESLIRGLDKAAGQGDTPAVSHDGPFRAHRAILRALEARDGPRARDVVSRHLLGFEALLAGKGIELAIARISDLMEVMVSGGSLPRR